MQTRRGKKREGNWRTAKSKVKKHFIQPITHRNHFLTEHWSSNDRYTILEILGKVAAGILNLCSANMADQVKSAF